ncbi:MAG TPA: NlpC/P60 family protein [Syntrophorhabdales bacterium]|nr:NlpC/P60 family protein [Syntrophorhabdales bacterium]
MAEQHETDQLLVVRVPVANLRREPVEAHNRHTHDDLQETQLLFNETLLYRGEKADWYYVEAREQVKAKAEKGWQGYPGWVGKESVSIAAEIPRYNSVVKSRIARLLSRPAEAAPPVLFLSLGTRLMLTEQSGTYQRVSIGEGGSAWISKTDVAMNAREASSDDLRRNLLQTASLFIGVPYLWGGRSMFMADLTKTVTGVDCSGLTNLVYRANSIDIPRDAHDQWLVSKRLPDGPPRAGDLIFVSQENLADSVDHVVLSTGGERFIEAGETGSAVKERTFLEKFGTDLAGLEKLKFTIQGKRVYLTSMAALNKAP